MFNCFSKAAWELLTAVLKPLGGATVGFSKASLVSRECMHMGIRNTRAC